MPVIHVSRNQHINASVDKVFKIISDMGQWAAWSPWLIMEPEAVVELAADRQSYQWSGKRVGAGRMELSAQEKNKTVDYNLSFFKPWKSTANVQMALEQQDDGTNVTWNMKSQLPFFMFFMEPIIKAFCGMDFERGLRLLKDYAEDGKVHSKIEFTGKTVYEGGPYVGIKQTINLEDIELVLTEDFRRLLRWADNQPDNIKNIICIYHKYSPLWGIVTYTAAISCHEAPENVPERFIRGVQKPTNIHTLTHIGPYHHLGNVWSTARNMIRSKEIKARKSYHPFELYENNPLDTDILNFRTRINFAVK